MTSDNLRGLFRYNYWANARIFATISQLTDDEFGRTIAGSYGSLRSLFSASSPTKTLGESSSSRLDLGRCTIERSDSEHSLLA
jgi:hypothetical protein